MNASLQRIETWARLAAAVVLVGTTSGCMAYDPFNRDIDPNSAAAQRVAELARADRTYPRWSQFPAAPQNVPTDTDIRNQVLGLEAAELQLNREVSAIDWTLDESDGAPWASRTLNRIDPRLSRPADPQAVQEALAWAERMRERSVAPPPINY